MAMSSAAGSSVAGSPQPTNANAVPKTINFFIINTPCLLEIDNSTVGAFGKIDLKKFLQAHEYGYETRRKNSSSGFIFTDPAAKRRPALSSRTTFF
ncbi:hypothetical protein [Aurantiacibacter hainanensis]|uniref:hypothetical protein n=1 Tax=Aurantiacibacter hainanensis TaxID=3076114 RepID=UPI0030C673B3